MKHMLPLNLNFSKSYATNDLKQEKYASWLFN